MFASRWFLFLSNGDRRAPKSRGSCLGVHGSVPRPSACAAAPAMSLGLAYLFVRIFGFQRTRQKVHPQLEAHLWPCCGYLDPQTTLKMESHPIILGQYPKTCVLKAILGGRLKKNAAICGHVIRVGVYVFRVSPIKLLDMCHLPVASGPQKSQLGPKKSNFYSKMVQNQKSEVRKLRECTPPFQTQGGIPVLLEARLPSTCRLEATRSFEKGGKW